MKNYIANITVDGGKSTHRTATGNAKTAQEFHKDIMKGLDWSKEEILDIFNLDTGHVAFRLHKGFFE